MSYTLWRHRRLDLAFRLYEDGSCTINHNGEGWRKSAFRPEPMGLPVLGFQMIATFRPVGAGR